MLWGVLICVVLVYQLLLTYRLMKTIEKADRIYEYTSELESVILAMANKVHRRKRR